MRFFHLAELNLSYPLAISIFQLAVPNYAKMSLLLLIVKTLSAIFLESSVEIRYLAIVRNTPTPSHHRHFQSTPHHSFLRQTGPAWSGMLPPHPFPVKRTNQNG